MVQVARVPLVTAYPHRQAGNAGPKARFLLVSGRTHDGASVSGVLLCYDELAEFGYRSELIVTTAPQRDARARPFCAIAENPISMDWQIRAAGAAELIG